MSDLPVPPSPSAEPTDETGPARCVTGALAPDRLAFFQRIAEGNVRDRETSSVVRAHLVALEHRIAQASQSLALGHLGSARAFLEAAHCAFDAALQALPKL
jgi:hypothetical protein